MNLRQSIAAMGLLLATACTSGADHIPLRIATSPAAQPVGDAILACAPTSGDIFTTIDILYPGTFELADYDFYIRLGEPEEDVDAILPLASERVVIVLNHQGSLATVNRETLVELLTGRIRAWSEIGGQDETVTVWIGPESDEGRAAVEDELLHGAPIIGGALIAPNPSGLLDNVARTSSGMGILPAAWADDRVEIIDLDIEVPVLAISARDLGPAANEMLACLQGGKGQDILGQRYKPID